MGPELSQNELILRGVHAHFFQAVEWKICSLWKYKLKDHLTIQPSGIPYLLVTAVNHDNLFSHCKLIEVHHIMKADISKHEYNCQCQYTGVK